MNRNYLKNLYLQQQELEHILTVFIERISKLVSIEIINTVILAIDRNEVVVNDLLALFLLHLESNALFYEEFIKADFHLFLFKITINITQLHKVKVHL